MGVTNKCAAIRLTTIVLAVLLAACGKPEPIRIGFVAGLTGRVADLGVAGRNGAMLAIEGMNQAGGINGRAIELLVRDDEQNPETAKRAVTELLAWNPDAIIGPMTSSMAMAVVPLVNNSKTILVSPTVTTTELAGMDDRFIRVIATTKDYAIKSARYHFEKLGYRTVAAIYDVTNRSYTDSWLENFRLAFESLGGRIIKVLSFRSGNDAVFYRITKDLLSVKPDFVLIITNAVDAALICQQVRKIAGRVPIVMSEWGSTERFIELGGAATEGVHVAQLLDRNNTSVRYRAFYDAYRERFGQAPGFAGVAGYDAGLVVLESLAARKKGQSLKEAITEKGVFDGVQQTIRIDGYGDADRTSYITLIQNGRYITVE